MLDAIGLLDHFEPKVAERVIEAENQIDMYEDRLGEYLVKIGTYKLTDKDGRAVKLLHIIGDLERISDHAVNLTEVADEINTKKIQFSPRDLDRVMRGGGGDASTSR